MGLRHQPQREVPRDDAKSALLRKSGARVSVVTAEGRSFFGTIAVPLISKPFGVTIRRDDGAGEERLLFDGIASVIELQVRAGGSA